VIFRRAPAKSFDDPNKIEYVLEIDRARRRNAPHGTEFASIARELPKCTSD
jgi:hypothetical protein